MSVLRSQAIFLAVLCQGSVSSESAKMCVGKEALAELKHFEKLKMNVNGLPILERRTACTLRTGLAEVGEIEFRPPG